MHDTYADQIADRPHPLLATDENSDFARNFRELEFRARRPYSLLKVLRSFCRTPPKLDGFEMEVHEELLSLNRARSVVGKLVPLQALSTLKRDLSIGTYPQIVHKQGLRSHLGGCTAPSSRGSRDTRH